MPRIVFKNNEHPPVELSEPLVVGRSEAHANAVVKDSRLSRAHCRFERREDAWAVVDLDSQNGTFLNGRRVKEANLKGGDVVTIGAIDMQFESTGGPASGIMEGSLEHPDSTATVVAPAALVLIQGSLADKIHPITHDPYNVGRKPDNHLCLENDGKASGYHARIRREGEAYAIEDLGSTNGTLVNGVKIDHPVQLRTGMKLVLGSQLLRFEMHGRPNESSGHTAPGISAAEMKLRRDIERAPVGEASEVELEAAEAEDRAALTQKIRFSGGGGALFGFIEVLVVLAIAGAALFAAWTMTVGGDQSAGGTSGGAPPARDGGLLAGNPSFDDRDEGGFPRGWRYVVSGTDNFSLAEGAKGGEFGLQIGRFTAANQFSLAISDAVEFTGRGLLVSAFAINPEHETGRMGSAVVQVYWLAHKRDREPILVSPVSAKSSMKDWTELAGSVASPPGAKAFSIAVGISGSAGTVMFDELTVTADHKAASGFKDLQVSAPGGLTWKLSRAGFIELSDAGGPLIKGGRILLYSTEGREDPLDPLHVLLEQPDVSATGDAIRGRLTYFDPLAAAEMRLYVELGGSHTGASFVASVEPAGSADMTRASRYVALSGLATPRWIPAQIVRVAPKSEAPAEFVDEIGVGDVQRAEFGRLIAADTGSGNIMESPSARAWIWATGGGRELLLQAQQRIDLSFLPGRGSEELQVAVSMISTMQPGEDQCDRVNRALAIMLDHPYNQMPAAAAAEAVDGASKHYRLRLIELRDGINVPQLTRNEQLYRSAMQEAIATAERLHAQASGWAMAQERIAAVLQGAGMNRRSRDTGELARAALNQLVQVAAEFDELAERARKSLFLLELETEQRESESIVASARDFLQSGQYVQGMLKLRMVVQRYPRCLRGIEAKERLADVAGILLDEMAQYDRQGLKTIARDNAAQARELIMMVRAHLLLALLSLQQQQWLRDLAYSAEIPPERWLAREEILAKKLQELWDKLPADLRKE